MRKRKRPYVQKARREQREQTRQRIVEALVKLHQEVGPKNTTISAVAQEAGVQRLTVYRHFPDEASMLQACSSHYVTDHPPPFVEQWSSGEDARVRALALLQAVYTYFGETEAMLGKIYRDVAEVEPLAGIMAGFDAHFRGLADHMANDMAEGEPSRELKAVARHLVRFPAWQTFSQEGVDNADMARLALVWLEALSRKPV